MKNTWFIADTHFGHANIIKFESEARPFASIDDMNEEMIQRWNKVVAPDDVVYHLGDFAFGKTNIAIAGRLQGKKRLILGNHDSYGLEEYAKYFEKVLGSANWHGGVLSHIPVHTSQLDHRWQFNLHGHLHSRQIEDKRYINLSCEHFNLTPVHEDVVMDLVRCLK